MTISKELESEDVKINEIGYEIEKHNQAKDKLSICQKEFEELQKEVGILNGQFNSTVERIDELKKELEVYIHDKKELEKIGRFTDLLNEIRKLYGKDGLQKDLRNKSRPLIEKNTFS